MNAVKVGSRVRISLRGGHDIQPGIYSGQIEYIERDHVGVWVRWKGRGAADGFVAGAARTDENGVWIEGR